MKPPTCLTNPLDPIVIPHVSPNHIDWECELGVVIGKTCRTSPNQTPSSTSPATPSSTTSATASSSPTPTASPATATSSSTGNTASGTTPSSPSAPASSPPSDVPDPQSLTLRLTVNGQVKQHGSTAQMIFPVAAIVSFLSQIMTLEPGDLIATGTPSGVGHATGTYLKPGDQVVAEVEGIGQLKNPVIVDR